MDVLRIKQVVVCRMLSQFFYNKIEFQKLHYIVLLIVLRYFVSSSHIVIHIVSVDSCQYITLFLLPYHLLNTENTALNFSISVSPSVATVSCQYSLYIGEVITVNRKSDLH